jgi:hypothetical protein
MMTRENAGEVRVYYRFEELDEADADAAIEIAPVSARKSIFTPGPENVGFWKRQFGDQPTKRQKIWDWTFGVVMPMLCFYFDPFVFRGWVSNESPLREYQIPAYMIAFVAIMTLAAWLLWGEKLGPGRVIVAWVMLAGAIMAGLIGLVLFPFSMLGLLFIIGVLGFTPIFTAIIYSRNAVRAFRSAARTKDA